MSNPEEKSEKIPQKNKSKEEKIYIPEDEENVEEIDEEDNDIEELVSDDSQAEIHILEDNSNKNNKKRKKGQKKIQKNQIIIHPKKVQKIEIHQP